MRVIVDKILQFITSWWLR